MKFSNEMQCSFFLDVTYYPSVKIAVSFTRIEPAWLMEDARIVHESDCEEVLGL